MKNLNNYIVEKLKLNSQLLKAQTTDYDSGDTYKFKDFCDMVKIERNVELNSDPSNPYLEYAIRHFDERYDIQKMQFVDVTNDPEEIKFFEKKILSVYNKNIKRFIKYYGVFTDSPEYNHFFHYFNTDYNNIKWQYRYGYSIGEDLNDIQKLRIFRLEKPE